MVVMRTGTSYEQSRDGKPLSKKFHECKKCHDKVYVNEPNFQECMIKASKNR